MRAPSTQMHAECPRIVSREEVVVSPWVRVVRKTVQFAADRPAEVYHCLSQPDYLAVLAKTANGFIPVVRQYRPAVEAESWELPAGLVDAGESPEAACRRELKEETGLEAVSVMRLGSYDADPGRMENQLHAFFVKASQPDPGFVGETGQAVEFVSERALCDAVLSGKIRYLHHVGIIAVALVRQLLTMPPDWGSTP